MNIHCFLHNSCLGIKCFQILFWFSLCSLLAAIMGIYSQRGRKHKDRVNNKIIKIDSMKSMMIIKLLAGRWMRWVWLEDELLDLLIGAICCTFYSIQPRWWLIIIIITWRNNNFNNYNINNYNNKKT